MSEERNKNKSLLKSYYSEAATPQPVVRDPLDINSSSFDSDLYLSQHIKVILYFFYFIICQTY